MSNTNAFSRTHMSTHTHSHTHTILKEEEVKKLKSRREMAETGREKRDVE